MLLAESEMSATPASGLALLDDSVLFAIRCWPAVAVRLLKRTAEQSQTLEVQFVITQLPRVDQRVFALLWLLAERWGEATKLGTHVPLNLTHETLGALIGARRPTVTLARRELSDRGALVKQPHGWLLIEPPAQPTGSIPAQPRLRSPVITPHPQRQPQRRPDEHTPRATLSAFANQILEQRWSTASASRRSMRSIVSLWPGPRRR